MRMRGRCTKSWRKGEKLQSVLLESGDALVFGGRARGIIHAVPRIQPGTAPRPAALHCGQGRLNLNFREL